MEMQCVFCEVKKEFYKHYGDEVQALKVIVNTKETALPQT
jgi:hypothetical protein